MVVSSRSIHFPNNFYAIGGVNCQYKAIEYDFDNDGIMEDYVYNFKLEKEIPANINYLIELLNK